MAIKFNDTDNGFAVGLGEDYIKQRMVVKAGQTGQVVTSPHLILLNL